MKRDRVKMGLVPIAALPFILGACRSETPPPASAPAAPGARNVAATPDTPLYGPSPKPEAAATPTPTAPSPTAAPADAQPGSTRPAPASASSLPPFHPLADAAVGEWSRFRARDDLTEDLRIVRVDDRVVGVEVRMWRQGLSIGQPAVRGERRDEDPFVTHAKRTRSAVAVTEADVEAAGATWPCRVITETWTDEDVAYVRRSWVCERAPDYGLVRMEQTADGEPVASLELIDWGPRPR